MSLLAFCFVLSAFVCTMASNIAVCSFYSIRPFNQGRVDRGASKMYWKCAKCMTEDRNWSECTKIKLIVSNPRKWLLLVFLSAISIMSGSVASNPWIRTLKRSKHEEKGNIIQICAQNGQFVRLARQTMGNPQSNAQRYNNCSNYLFCALVLPNRVECCCRSAGHRFLQNH